MNEKKISEKEGLSLTNSSDYNTESIASLKKDFLRESVFTTLFNKAFFTPQLTDRVENIFLSKIYHEKKDQLFYRIKRNENKNHSHRFLLVNIYLEEGLQPLPLVENSLFDLAENLKNKKYEQIYFVVEYGVKNLLPRNATYVNHYFKLIHQYLNVKYDIVETYDLVRITDFSQWDYFEGDLKWAFPDSFFKHLVLSRGANDLGGDDALLDEVVENVALSEHHSMEIGKINSLIISEGILKARECGRAFFEKHKGASAITPSLFNSLVYFKS